MKLIALCLSAAALTACGTSTRELLLKAETELRIAEEKTRTIKAATEYRRAAALEKAVVSAKDEETKRTLIAADITRAALDKIGGTEAKRAPFQMQPSGWEMLLNAGTAIVSKAADVGLAVYGIRKNSDVSLANIAANRDVQIGAQQSNAQMFKDAGNTNSTIAAAGMGVAGTLGTAGYKSLSEIIGTLGKPNTYTLSDGSTFVGRDNTGNAGKDNRLSSPNTATCQSATGDASATPQAGSATTGTAGTVTLTMPPATATTECKP